MSDLLDFEKNLTEIEEELKSECENSYIIENNFIAIRDMIEVLILKRDARIKELESKLKSSPKVSPEPVKQNEPSEDKPKKECPPGKILNPKTGRCINKPKEKTQKRRGRPKKFDKPEEQGEPKPEKECPPGKILNPKTGRCINKSKEKTQKKRGRPKKSVVAEPEQMPSPKPMSSPKQGKSMSFDEALEYIRTNGKPGSYRKFLNGIKTKFGITLKYDNHGDDYAEPTLYFMKGKKECSLEEMEKVKQYVIDTAEKSKSPPSQRKVEPMKLANGKTINLDLGVNK